MCSLYFIWTYELYSFVYCLFWLHAQLCNYLMFTGISLHTGIERNQPQSRFLLFHTVMCIYLTSMTLSAAGHLLMPNNLLWMLQKKNFFEKNIVCKMKCLFIVKRQKGLSHVGTFILVVPTVCIKNKRCLLLDQEFPPICSLNNWNCKHPFCLYKVSDIKEIKLD